MTITDTEFTPYHRGRTVRHPLDPEFIAWDGEGITPPNQVRQDFVLFGNSKGFRVSGNRLSTEECLRLILDTERANPRAIHVGFAFGYDAEMILVDVPLRHMHILRRRGHVRWNGYRIEYRKGKWLQITRKTREESVTARIWDVWSFFSTSFVVAVREYLGDIPELAMIESGKMSRGEFRSEELDSKIIPYWEMELRLTVELMNTLRKRLYDADLPIRQWHGPGAIATFAMRKNGVAKAMQVCEPEINDAAQYAYAGGRFELFKIGWQKEKVYAYDIRSAYPAAIATLPDLSNGEWKHVDSITGTSDFGIYRIRFRHSELFTSRPMPYFFRDLRGAIHFPNAVEGWYWTPEAKISQYFEHAEIIEGWEFHHDGSRPLSWVEDVYETRAQWKREGNPSQLALKLLLNSMYGKFAQRVGWEQFNGPPKWHQLEWAGYITSKTRAILYRAMAESYAKGGLLGVETDGIFSTVPLTVEVGEKLGQWELTEYEQMVYLQSGFYFKKTDKGWSAKYRGFDKGSVSFEDAIGALGKWRPWDSDSRGNILGTSTRFTTMGLYLRIPNGEDWRNTWITAPRDLNLGQDGKRVHRSTFCPECQQKISPADAPHSLTIYAPTGGMSAPHSLPWKGQDDSPFRDIIENIDIPSQKVAENVNC